MMSKEAFMAQIRAAVGDAQMSEEQMEKTWRTFNSKLASGEMGGVMGGGKGGRQSMPSLFGIGDVGDLLNIADDMPWLTRIFAVIFGVYGMIVASSQMREYGLYMFCCPLCTVERRRKVKQRRAAEKAEKEAELKRVEKEDREQMKKADLVEEKIDKLREYERGEMGEGEGQGEGKGEEEGTKGNDADAAGDTNAGSGEATEMQETKGVGGEDAPDSSSGASGGGGGSGGTARRRVNAAKASGDFREIN